MKKINTYKPKKTGQKLFKDVANLIDEARKTVAYTVNAALTYMYWKIGKRINEEILQHERAEYGSQIVAALGQQLQNYYGKGFDKSSLTRMMNFAVIFPDEEIVVSLIQQLSWTHLIALLPLKDNLQRDFYVEMCKMERWSVRTLRKKIDGMLYERTAISRKPDELIKQEIAGLRDDGILTPDMVFQNPYFLDFAGLKDTYSEKNLEDAVVRKLEAFILELGSGFAFVERQKRMIIDGEDFKLLQLDKSGIRVAEYLTELPDRKLLQKKLNQAVKLEKKKREIVEYQDIK